MTTESQQPQTIEQNGVRLRPLRKTDAPTLFDYLRNPLVTEKTSFPEITIPMVEAMIARVQNRWAQGYLSKWGIVRVPTPTETEDDVLVGTCGFNDWSRPHGWAEIAFDLAQDQWGKGVMHQAVTALLNWTFAPDQPDQVHRVHGFVRVDNQRSARLLERLGFVREGCLRSYRNCRGRAHDFFIYGLLRADWETRLANLADPRLFHARRKL